MTEMKIKRIIRLAFMILLTPILLVVFSLVWLIDEDKKLKHFKEIYEN